MKLPEVQLLLLLLIVTWSATTSIKSIMKFYKIIYFDEQTVLEIADKNNLRQIYANILAYI